MKKFLILVSLFTFLSCSHLDKRDCEHINWREVGRGDGAVGQRSTYLYQHGLRCSQTPDEEEYYAGRKEGLFQFCTLKGGIQYGLEGGSYFGQCTGDYQSQEPDFLKGYIKGREVYLQSEEIRELTEKKERIEYELSTSFHDSEESYELESEKNAIKAQIAQEKAYLDKLIRSLPKIY